MQTSETSSTGHDTIDPRYDTARSTPAMCCRCPVCVLDQMTPTIRYGVKNQRDDYQFAYRHPKPQQPSQRAEHARYVNVHSCGGEHFLLIFQLKWAAMYP
jgi:hypothetical protein